MPCLTQLLDMREDECHNREKSPSHRSAPGCCLAVLVALLDIVAFTHLHSSSVGTPSS